MSKQPWDDPFFGGSKAKWLAYCRSALRKQWSRYPVKVGWIKANRFKIPSNKTYKNGKPRPDVWGGECAMCKGRFKMSELEVDHIIPAGKMDGLENISEWISRLFCHRDNLQFLCSRCHHLKSTVDRYNGSISYEDARRDAFYNETTNLPVAKQKAILAKLGLSEWDNNEERRKAAFKALLNITWK